MNKWTGSGFISRDIDVKDIQTKSGENMRMARFSVACQRKGKGAGADFISCVAYGKNAETLEKYFSKGKGIEISGHIQTGSYEKNGTKIYTTEIVVDELEFAKVRKSDEESTPVSGSYSSDTINNDTHTESTDSPQSNEQASAPDDSFMDIPDDITDDLPFR